MFNKLKNQKGQSVIEYALIAVILVAIILAAVQAPLQNLLTNLWAKVESSANNA